MSRLLIATGLVLGLAGAASAQKFLATNNLAATNGFTADGADQLITMDFATAAWGPVSGDGGIRVGGVTPVNGISGLDFDHTTGKLYGCTAFGSVPGNFYEINPATGVATLLGPTGVLMNDLSWDPVSKTMYGTAGGALYKVSLVNGATSLVGAYSVAGFLEVGLGFDSAGHVIVHDLVFDTIYRGTAPGSTTLAVLHVIGYNSNFSQGTFVDWTTNIGYHAAIDGGALSAPNYRFTMVPGSYVLASTFATHTNGLPVVEVGDLTMLLKKSCYADCEGDGDLDVFDFLCFQSEWAAKTAYGDCENDGDWDVFDFLCFQSAYANGCP